MIITVICLIILWLLLPLTMGVKIRDKKWFKRTKDWLYYNIWKPIESTILCIRFPFLYPRNRFTGLHYNNWKLIEIHRKIYKKYHVLDAREDAYNLLKAEANPNIWYLKKVADSGASEYWTNSWAKPYVLMIDFIHDYALQFCHCIPKYTEIDALKSEGYGWYKAFGIEFCKELRKQLIKEHRLFSFRITEWKEKYGEMRLYTDIASNEVYAIIDKYTEISRNTCCFCGKPAVYRTTPYAWELPYCKECYDKDKSPAMIAEIKNEKGEWIENKEYAEIIKEIDSEK